LAREHSARALELAREQFGLEPPQHLSILGIAAHWDGDDAAALSFLDRASEQAAALDWGEPTIRWWTDDHVELLLEHDRVEEAMRLLDRWEADAERRDREWVRAHATRCRGLAALTRGQVEPAEQLLLRAVAEHQAVGDPFGAARAQLALGVARRRMRQKRTARDAIEASIGGFARLGAAGWEGRARAELGRVGGRQREIGLSAAERRVAALVAEGRTNREVSAALFLAERTVASHLTHIYAKLGVRSRTELARRMR
jgi:DNA-binding CsgD family transcriptional regulator